MKLRQLNLLFCFFLLLLTGCSTYQPPVVIEEVGEPVSGSGEEEVEVTVQETPPEPPKIVAQAAESRELPVNNAVENLLELGEEKYDEGDYDSAIATAERALRIDRLNPRVYLLIAKSYWAKGAYGQASQTARQGLQYSAERSSVRSQLERYE